MPRLAEALHDAARRGWSVERVRRTGEVKVTPPDGHPIRVNNRRKDAPLTLILRLERKETDK